MIGTILSERYKIHELIGEGGMATVYRASDLRTGHDVAVKFLREEFRNDPEFLTRFSREATAASKMNHHNIVNLLDVGYSGETPYLVMDYVGGKTLKEIIRERTRLPVSISCQIAIRILSALQHAHAAGIIHRDIKPQNILVDQMGYVKVADFGIARLVGAGTAVLDGRDAVMGTVHYFSPEQASGETATAASDLYSVGIVLYEMLSGRVPFEGESAVAVAMQHLKTKARPLREVAPDTTPAVEAVVHKALEKDPRARYRTALEMAQALKLALEHPDREITRDTPVLPAVSTRANGALKSGRGRLGVALLTLLVLLGIAAGTAFIYRNVINATQAPFLIGEEEADAIRIARKAGLVPKISRQSSGTEAGIVILQSHNYEYPMKKGDSILITVSSGPVKQLVPRLVGESRESAAAALEKIGLNLLVVERRPSGNPYDTVISQEPEQGVERDYGDIVQVILSGGEVLMPETQGMPRDEALQVLQRARLRVYKVDELPVEDPAQFERVATQNPQAGTTVMEQTEVTLVVYVERQSEAPGEPGA